MDKVAAFIGEPIQGAGGVIIPPDSYWPEIQRICDKYGILLIADEVICGFGRTGHWFASEGFGIKPISCAWPRASPPAICRWGRDGGDRVARVLVEEGGEFNHGFTYSGHPVACAVAIANIQLMQRESIVKRVHDSIGPYLQRRWSELADHPLVGETRARAWSPRWK